MRNKVTIRPTVPEDLHELVPDGWPYRARAYTGLVDGRVIGIGGIGVLPGKCFIAFAHLTDEARQYPVALHKTALKTIAEAKERGARRIMAIPDASVPAAGAWLERLGFTEFYAGNGERFYQWRSSSSG